jgi:two-component system cell cycle sensor histidine kinase/response regulator CckA
LGNQKGDTMNPKILIVDDEPDILEIIENTLSQEGFEVVKASTGQDAIALFDAGSFELVITDMKMPGLNGMDVLKHVKQIDKDVEVIILTGYATLENAIQTLRNKGAHDYLRKPLEDIEELIISVSNALERRRLSIENKKMLTDLSVNKIELEAQNENLGQSQLELEAARDKYSDLYDFAPVSYFSINDKGIILEANLTASSLLEVERRYLIGKPFSHFITREYQNGFYFHHQNLIKSKEKQTCELKFVKKNGSEFYAHMTSTITREVEDNDNFIQISVVNINQRKLAEKALQASEEKYRSMMESMKDEVYICSPDYRIKYMNPSMINRLGWDAIDQLCYKTFYNNDEKCSWCKFDQIQQGEHIAYELNHPEDNRYLSTSNSPIYNPDGSILKLTILRDITQTKRMEDQLQHALKMESISTLSGGIAHQFNNALAAITGNLELLEMDIPGDETLGNYARKMRNSAQRMTKLTAQLLAYAKGGKYQAKNISLSDFARKTLPLIRHTMDSAIDIETDLPFDDCQVNVDLTQMQMVLSAVLVNSSEAMEGKGHISVTLQKVAILDDMAKDFPGLTPGDYACLTITDDGKGMDQDTKNRIFEPFFTTHFKGRGLGMAAAYGIIKNHDGWISVDSELSQGTIVKIYLPIVKVHLQENSKSGSKTQWIKGTGTILVIEDEEAVMNVTRAMLKRLGYSVLEAKTGQKAIDLVKTHDDDIDLALLDILLPDMNGNAIYPLLMEAHPNLKVIVFSGYSIEGPAQEILNAGAEAFIQKPFLMADLSEKVKKILEEK